MHACSAVVIRAEVIALVGVFSILIGAIICWLSGAILGPALLIKVCALFAYWLHATQIQSVALTLPYQLI